MQDTNSTCDWLGRAALALFDEAYARPIDPRGTWFVDNEPDCGILGTIAKLDAATASQQLRGDDAASVASHVGHIVYSLSLANRAVRGENPYKDADWAGSWDYRIVDEATWAELLAKYKVEYDAFRAAIQNGLALKDERITTGTLGMVAHGAWHLGALRQALGLITMPPSKK